MGTISRDEFLVRCRQAGFLPQSDSVRDAAHDVAVVTVWRKLLSDEPQAEVPTPDPGTLTSQSSAPSASELASQLVRSRALTRWQAEQLLRGSESLVVGGYRLDEPTEELADRAIFRARQLRDGLPVWLTRFPATDRQHGERLVRQLTHLTELRHEAFLPVLEVFLHGSACYVSSPQGDGHALKRYLGGDLSLDGLSFWRLLYQLAQALQDAYAARVGDGQLNLKRLMWDGERLTIRDFGWQAAIEDCRQESATQPGERSGAAESAHDGAWQRRAVTDWRALGQLALRWCQAVEGASPAAAPAAQLPGDNFNGPAADSSIGAELSHWATRCVRCTAADLPRWIEQSLAELVALHPAAGIGVDNPWSRHTGLEERGSASPVAHAERATHPAKAPQPQRPLLAPPIAAPAMRLAPSGVADLPPGHDTPRSAAETGVVAAAAELLPHAALGDTFQLPTANRSPLGSPAAAPAGTTSPAVVRPASRVRRWGKEAQKIMVGAALALSVGAAVMGFGAILLQYTGGTPTVPEVTEDDRSSAPRPDEVVVEVAAAASDAHADANAASADAQPDASADAAAGIDSVPAEGGAMADSGEPMPGSESSSGSPAAMTEPSASTEAFSVSTPSQAPETMDASSPTPVELQEATGGTLVAGLDLWPVTDAAGQPRTGLKLGQLMPAEKTTTCRLDWVTLSTRKAESAAAQWKLASIDARTWELRRVTEEASSPRLRVLLNDQAELVADWLDPAEMPEIAERQLANSWFIVQYGAETVRIQGRQIASAKPLMLELQQPPEWQRFELRPAAGDDVRLRVEGLRGLLEGANAVQGPEFSKDRGALQFVVREEGQPRLRVDIEVNLARDPQVRLVPYFFSPASTVTLPFNAAGLKRLAAELAGSLQQAEALKAEKGRLDNVRSFARRPEPEKQAIRADYDRRVQLLERYAEEIRKLNSFCETAQGAGSTNFRIFLTDGEGHELTLIHSGEAP